MATVRQCGHTADSSCVHVVTKTENDKMHMSLLCSPIIFIISFYVGGKISTIQYRNQFIAFPFGSSFTLGQRRSSCLWMNNCVRDTKQTENESTRNQSRTQQLSNLWDYLWILINLCNGNWTKEREKERCAVHDIFFLSIRDFFITSTTNWHDSCAHAYDDA